MLLQIPFSLLRLSNTREQFQHVENTFPGVSEHFPCLLCEAWSMKYGLWTLASHKWQSGCFKAAIWSLARLSVGTVVFRGGKAKQKVAALTTTAWVMRFGGDGVRVCLISERDSTTWFLIRGTDEAGRRFEMSHVTSVWSPTPPSAGCDTRKRVEQECGRVFFTNELFLFNHCSLYNYAIRCGGALIAFPSKDPRRSSCAQPRFNWHLPLIKSIIQRWVPTESFDWTITFPWVDLTLCESFLLFRGLYYPFICLQYPL